jgi:hypothetical protein
MDAASVRWVDTLVAMEAAYATGNVLTPGRRERSADWREGPMRIPCHLVSQKIIILLLTLHTYQWRRLRGTTSEDESVCASLAALHGSWSGRDRRGEDYSVDELHFIDMCLRMGLRND